LASTNCPNKEGRLHRRSLYQDRAVQAAFSAVLWGLAARRLFAVSLTIDETGPRASLSHQSLRISARAQKQHQNRRSIAIASRARGVLDGGLTSMALYGSISALNLVRGERCRPGNRTRFPPTWLIGDGYRAAHGFDTVPLRRAYRRCETTR